MLLKAGYEHYWETQCALFFLSLEVVGQVIKKKKLVTKTDGTVPSPGAVSKAAKDFMLEKKIRGRKKGWRKTTKEEDRKVMDTFKKLRPPGHGVDSRVVHKALPKKLKKKIVRRTVIRRLAAKGYRPERKISKSDPGVKLAKKRVKFSTKYGGWTPDDWETKLQGVGDFKEFTWYPKELKGKHKKLRAPWTYMTKQDLI